MPFMKERVAATYAKEILRVVSGAELAENAVIDGTQVPVNSDGRRILETGTVMVYVGVNEIQTVTVTGVPTGGTFTLTFGGQTTSALAFNASAAAVKAALEALSSIGADNVSVSGSNGGPYTVTFTGALGGRDVAQLTATASLTGGTTPNVTVATATAGGTSPDSTQKVRPAPASGIAAAQVAGILMHTTEFWPGSTEANKDDAAVALFTKNCHFAAPQLTGYSGNASAVQTAMQGGGNGRCGNCTFA